MGYETYDQGTVTHLFRLGQGGIRSDKGMGRKWDNSGFGIDIAIGTSEASTCYGSQWSWIGVRGGGGGGGGGLSFRLWIWSNGQETQVTRRLPGRRRRHRGMRELLEMDQSISGEVWTSQFVRRVLWIVLGSCLGRSKNTKLPVFGPVRCDRQLCQKCGGSDLILEFEACMLRAVPPCRLS